MTLRASRGAAAGPPWSPRPAPKRTPCQKRPFSRRFGPFGPPKSLERAAAAPFCCPSAAVAALGRPLSRPARPAAARQSAEASGRSPRLKSESRPRVGAVLGCFGPEIQGELSHFDQDLIDLIDFEPFRWSFHLVDSPAPPESHPPAGSQPPVRGCQGAPAPRQHLGTSKRHRTSQFLIICTVFNCFSSVFTCFHPFLDAFRPSNGMFIHFSDFQ